jgi:hypothetical protein
MTRTESTTSRSSEIHFRECISLQLRILLENKRGSFFGHIEGYEDIETAKNGSSVPYQNLLHCIYTAKISPCFTTIR